MCVSVDWNKIIDSNKCYYFVYYLNIKFFILKFYLDDPGIRMNNGTPDYHLKTVHRKSVLCSPESPPKTSKEAGDHPMLIHQWLDSNSAGGIHSYEPFTTRPQNPVLF